MPPWNSFMPMEASEAVAHEGLADEAGMANEAGLTDEAVTHEGTAREAGMANEAGLTDEAVAHEGLADEAGMANEAGLTDEAVTHEGTANEASIDEAVVDEAMVDEKAMVEVAMAVEKERAKAAARLPTPRRMRSISASAPFLHRFAEQVGDAEFELRRSARRNGRVRHLRRAIAETGSGFVRHHRSSSEGR